MGYRSTLAKGLDSSYEVYIYLPDLDVEILNNPVKVNGDPLLAGFNLDLTKIW